MTEGVICPQYGSSGGGLLPGSGKSMCPAFSHDTHGATYQSALCQDLHIPKRPGVPFFCTATFHGR